MNTELEEAGYICERDYFAAASLTGLRASKLWSNNSSTRVVEMAYADADAMLEARSKATRFP